MNLILLFFKAKMSRIILFLFLLSTFGLSLASKNVLKDLESFRNRNSGRNSKNSILPELPTKLHFPEFTIHEQENAAAGYWAGTISYQGDIYGLENLNSTVTYDCQNNIATFDLTLPQLIIQGDYRIDVLALPIGGEVVVYGYDMFQVLESKLTSTVRGTLREVENENGASNSNSSSSLTLENITVTPGILPNIVLSNGNLTMFWDDFPVVDPVEREFVLAVFKEGFSPSISYNANLALGNWLNVFLAEFTLEEFIAVINPACSMQVKTV